MNFFFGQLRVDVEAILIRDNKYYLNLVNQAKNYKFRIGDKITILRVILGVYKLKKNKDGTFRKVFQSLKEVPDFLLNTEQKNKILRYVVQLAFDSKFNSLVLPFFEGIFKVEKFNNNLKFANNFTEKDLDSAVQIIPELPHTDNVDDFEKALKDFYDSQQEGAIGIPHSGNIRYRFTHDAVKDFSEKNKSEKIALMCLDVKRKHPNHLVSHPHYNLLQGYDFSVRDMTFRPFLRLDGRGPHDFKEYELKKFNQDNLAIEKWDKSVVFDDSKVDTSCPEFSKYTNKELFRKAVDLRSVDVVLKIMEAFDSRNQMNKCQPYIISKEFVTYLKAKESLKNAYKIDFYNPQKNMLDFGG